MHRIVPAVFMFIAVLSCACRERIIVYPPPRVPDVSTSRTDGGTPVAVSLPSGIDTSSSSGTVAKPESLVSAEAYFSEGLYPQAVKEYQAYLNAYPQAESKDRILYKIGMAHAMAPSPDRSLAEAEAALNRLVQEFPESDYRSEAELILDLIGQVGRLNRDVRTSNSKISRLEEELKRLKDIDLQRRPSRPAE